MKNVFIRLSEKGGMMSRRIAINMTRVQEMWPEPDGSTRLVMNIPNAEVMVMESIETILQRIEEANVEHDPEVRVEGPSEAFVSGMMAKARKEMPDGK